MPLLRVTGTQLVTALERAGFAVIRTHGSHSLLRHSDGRTTVVPVHAGQIIGPGLLGRILHEARMSREELLSLLG